MKEKDRKTTKKEFEEFKRGFNETVEILGLKGYQIYFFHEDLKKESFADITIDQEGMIASARFNLVDRGRIHVEHTPYGSGVHEALHLLMARLYDLTTSRYVNREEIIEAEHDIVRRLEKLFI